MKKVHNAIVLMFLILVTGIKCIAQNDDKTQLRQVVKDNQEAVDAIAMYPRETRKIIFQAAAYPDLIAKLNSMQKNSQTDFEKLITSLGKEEQEKIWNLTRYDSLISDLAADHKKSKDEINNLLVKYPEEIHKTALEVGEKDYDLIVQIDKLNKNYNSDFEKLLSTYPLETVNTFREMIKMPDVLNILFDHMQYTVVIGDYYKKNPERVLHKTDSLNAVLTQKNTQEGNDWKQSMNDNPQVQKEYTQAAQDYAQENGYQPDDYNAPLTPDVTNYNTNPYSWWCGYPSWYPYNYWNPYPYWYDWGFYYGPGRHPVFFGLPSPYFMNWYFYNPEHSYKYAALSNHYYNYYNNHPKSMNNSISISVNNWRNANKNIVTENWDKNNTNRTQLFKEYGQMESARMKYNSKNPQQQISQTAYLQKESNKYRTLSSDVSKNQINQNDSKSKSVQQNMPEPVRTPTVTIPNRYKAPVNEQLNNKQSEQNLQQHNNNVQNNNISKQQLVNTSPQTNNNNSKQRPENVNIQPRNSNPPVRQTENSNQMRNAQQYHQNTWNQMQHPQQNYTPPRQQESRQMAQPSRQSPSNNGRR